MIGGDAELRPRTVAAIADARAAGIHVIVATGRMFRSVRPYLEQADITDPVVCYQGAAVVDPVSGTFLFHEPIPLQLARNAIELLLAKGYPPNCYVNDELAVAQRTPYSDAYSTFQHLPVHEVGDLLAWISEPPTKLVAVAEPEELEVLRVALEARFRGSLYVTTSLPWLLELGHPAVSKGTGLRFVAERVGFALEHTVAFGDGENDVELIEAAGFGIAVDNAHPALRERADWICPGPDEEGVATVIETFLNTPLD